MSEKLVPQDNVNAQNVTLEIQRLYAKEQSCKVLHGHQAFQSQEKPETQTEMSINQQPIAQDTYEVTLNITVTTKLEQRTAYTANIQHSCVIKTNTRDEKQLGHIMNVHVPHLLYPYARKAIADLISCGGFAPLFLPIVDFASMYQRRLQEAEQAAEKAVEKATTTV